MITNSFSFILPLFALVLSVVASYAFLQIEKRTWWKFGIIILLNGMALMIYKALPSYMGWAVTTTPSQNFMIQWVVINEPNDLTNSEGGIYLWVKGFGEDGDWVVDMLGFNAASGEPRAIKLAYTKQSHEKMQNIMEQLKSGEKVYGKVVKQKLPPQKDKVDDGERQEIDVFEQYDLPKAYRQRKIYE